MFRGVTRFATFLIIFLAIRNLLIAACNFVDKCQISILRYRVYKFVTALILKVKIDPY